MRNPTNFELALGRFVRSKLGSNTKVARFGDDDGTNDVFIVTGEDCPDKGVTSYGSVGLSNRPQFSGTAPVSVEIVGACASTADGFDNLVASCVFDSVKNQSNIAYGAFIENIVSQYHLSNSLKHVTFIAPFLWQGLDKAIIEERTVYWLLVLPISDTELEYLKLHGISALEAIFEKAQIDVFDINRPAAV